VVIAVLGILAALLLPALNSAREAGRRATCLSNLPPGGDCHHRVCGGSRMAEIPFWSEAPPFTSPASFYPSTGSPTSLLFAADGRPVGLGLLLSGHLANQPKVCSAPGPTSRWNAGAELARVGVHQAQAVTYYRSCGGTRACSTTRRHGRPHSRHGWKTSETTAMGAPSGPWPWTRSS